jgi:CubicO group peptidase (beta-lactamase class C family)
MSGTALNDAELERWLTARLGARHPISAVATVSGGIVRTAVRGCPPEADFEIGSIAKAITGMLYTDAVGRAEVRPDTTLGEVLPLRDSPVAAVTLGNLSTHTSGLPRLPRSMQPVRKSVELWRRGTNPYGESVDDLLLQARGVRLGAPRPRYSNLGFELLGHAVASAAGSTYPELLRERLSVPLGLGSMYAPATTGELSAHAVIGRSRSGRFREPWTGAAIAPAGGIRSSVGDLAALAQALLAGTAPGHSALDPVRSFAGRTRIGAGWLTLDARGRTVTWHNGGTGGFRSWLGLDRAAGTAVVVLTASSVSVDGAGFTLLLERHTRDAAGTGSGEN